MAFINWEIEGLEVVNCNCSFGCPCQFNSLPTHGHCRAHMWLQIDRGRFGDVKLDGTRCGVIAAWPGPIHKGQGTHQVVVDDRATPEQRAALEAIGKGKETEPGKLAWFIYAAMSTTFLPTAVARIDVTADPAARTATVRVPGVIDGSIAPILNPVTGIPHRAAINLPAGMEYTVAEVASGTAKSQGGIEIDFNGTHAHFCRVHWGTSGVIR